MKSNVLFILTLLLAFPIYAQNSDTITIKNERVMIELDTIAGDPYEPLAPSRAAFYSAVLPGLGQAYNKKYWKIPIIYAGIATGIYFYITTIGIYSV